MILANLIDAIHPTAILGSAAPETPVESLHYQSRDVVPGGVFFAIQGFAADGHDYIDDACQRGAAAVVAEKSVAPNVPVLQVTNSRVALAHAAAAYYGHPSRDLTVIGLTGTNVGCGKCRRPALPRNPSISSAFWPTCDSTA